MIAALWSNVAYAQDCNWDGSNHATEHVKTTCDSFIISVDPNTGFTEEWDIIEHFWTVNSFSSVSVTIWNGSGDPNSHTSNPVTTHAAQDMNGNGVWDGPFTFSTHSLKDLGTYHFTWTGTMGQWQVFCCDANGNNFAAYVTTPALATPFDFQVTNSAPTASPAISGDLHVGHTVTLTANSSDPDGGAIAFHEWSVVTKPAGTPDSIASASQATATIALSDPKSIGDWNVKLKVADNEGELKEFTKSFTIANQPPTLTISGPTTIDALKHLHLEASPAKDADNETITWVWDIVQAPPGASHQPQSGFSTAQVIDFVTGPGDIGIWKFKCTASDGHNASVNATATVEVKAVPPKITIADLDVVIKEGQTIHFETTTLDDAYGAPLQFAWEALQVPIGAGIGLTNVGSGPSIDFANATAGTWKFKLTVTDQVNEQADETVRVLVDGDPTATIVGPDISGNLTQVLTLDGSTSADPDSPATPPDYGHLHAGAVDISPGITTYMWGLLDVPPEYYQSGDYYPGPVADVLGINGSSAMLQVPAGKLKPGHYVFRLEVIDGESNSASTDHAMEILDEGIPPTAILSAPQFFLTNGAGVALSNIGADGSLSIDLDNLLHDPYAPGLGITNYEWTYVTPPVGCVNPPALPSGPTAATLTLYANGDLVPPSCQGIYQLQLTVTDDDTPTPKQASSTTTLFIGNCLGDICIDYPLQTMPAFVKYSDQTDIIIYYHLNSVLYDQAVFAEGLRVHLIITHENDVIPTYENVWDVDLLPSDKGGALAIHWAGYDSSHQRPKPGKYTVSLQLVDSSGSASPFGAVEQDSIWIQVIDVAVANTSDKYLDRDKLVAGTDKLDVNYTVVGQNPGQTEFDQLIYRVRSAANILVYTGIEGPPFTGTFHWNGDLGAANFLPAGDYKLELELLDQGASLGTSPAYDFTVFEVKVLNPIDTDGNGKIDDAEEDNLGKGSEFTFWDPANRFHGSNVQNSAQLRMDCSATVIPASLAVQLRWRIFNDVDVSNATGALFAPAGTVAAWDALALPEGQGTAPKFTVDGMPALNDDFGRKTIRVQLIDPANPANVIKEITVPVEVFWPKLVDLAGLHDDANFAKNHPGLDQKATAAGDQAGQVVRDGTRMPNWMFFWGQVVEANDGIPADHLRYADTLLPGFFAVTPAVFYFDDGYTGRHDRLVIVEQAQDADADPDGAGPRDATSGVDTFRDTVIHENHHAIDESVGFSNSALSSGITGATLVADAHWSFNLPKPAVIPVPPLVGRVYNHFRDLDADGDFADAGEDLDIDGDDMPNTIDPAPAVPFVGDVGNLALDAEPDKENALAPKDWGNPGKRHKTDDNPKN
jgi:hypothetical protein